MFSFFIALLAIAQFLCSADAAAIGDKALVSRQSTSARTTFYGGNVQGGNCAFSTYTLPAGIYGTALSGASWNTAASCGGCIAVTGPNGKTITAMIVDKCPECPANALDLFPDAFAQLASPSTGVIQTSWIYTPCPISTPLQILMKSGVSRYWFSAQVVNAKRRTTKLEFSINSGSTWTTATRQDYNYFEYSAGAGAATAWIRVTSATGTTVIIKNVPQTSGSLTTATANYA